MKNQIPLFIIPSLIWGSTWYVITFQLGVAAPVVSVGFRFVLASLMLIGFCKLKGISLKFTVRQHLFIFLQGVLLFGFNYWFAYASELYIPSGLVAVCFSLIVFLNTIFSRVFFKTPIQKNLLIGALFGVVGTYLIFSTQLENISFTSERFLGLMLCVVSVVLASLGNITSAYNQKSGLKVYPVNAMAMLYGGILMCLIAWTRGNDFFFTWTWEYAISLFYLSLFGSVIAFGTYLTLIGKIGAALASFVLVIIPIIAIAISYFFENMALNWITGIGMLLIVLGNTFAFGLFKKLRKA